MGRGEHTIPWKLKTGDPFPLPSSPAPNKNFLTFFWVPLKISGNTIKILRECVHLIGCWLAGLTYSHCLNPDNADLAFSCSELTPVVNIIIGALLQTSLLGLGDTLKISWSSKGSLLKTTAHFQSWAPRCSRGASRREHLAEQSVGRAV